MSPEEYVTTATQVMLLAQLTLHLDLKAFMEHIEISDALGPLIATQQWQKGHKNLDDMKALVEPLREFQLAAQKLGIASRSVYDAVPQAGQEQEEA